MAVVKPSSLISTISGTIGKGKTGAITYSNYASGITVAKGYAVPTDYNSPKQQAIRTAFKAIAAAWSALSPAQKALWDAHVAVLQAAANSGVRLKGGVRDMARLDKPGRTGYQAFVKVNLFNNLATNSIVTTPNAQNISVPIPTIVSVTWYHEAPTITYTMVAGTYTLVLWVYDPTAYFHKQIAIALRRNPPYRLSIFDLVTKTGISEAVVLPVDLFGQIYVIDSHGNTSVPTKTFPIHIVIVMTFSTQPTNTARGQKITPSPVVHLSYDTGLPVISEPVDITANVANTFDPSSNLSVNTDSSGNAVFNNLKVSASTPTGSRYLIASYNSLVTNSHNWNVL